MNCSIKKSIGLYTRKVLSLLISVLFVIQSVITPAFAQAVFSLPAPGAVVGISPSFQPAVIKGINIHKDNPLKFDFIIDRGDDYGNEEEFHKESNKLIKYFLASLTIPERNMWVNLSPYEKDRIIPEEFGKTEMGRDLLAQDYMLKQLSSSLMHPDEDFGNAFWERVYERAQEEFGSTDIPMNTFNKIWIVPQEALVYEHANGAFIVESHLKVMLEEDYIALDANKGSNAHGLGDVNYEEMDVISGVSAEIVREVLIPEIEREVNEGETFANLRQIYNSVILATWYKKALADSLIGQLYVDQNKTQGVDVQDESINQKIYEQYVEAFKIGVANIIREEFDPVTQEVIPRKYFTGGAHIDPAMLIERTMIGEGSIKKGNIDKASLGKDVLDKVMQALNEYAMERGTRPVIVTAELKNEYVDVAADDLRPELSSEAVQLAINDLNAMNPQKGGLQILSEYYTALASNTDLDDSLFPEEQAILGRHFIATGWNNSSKRRFLRRFFDKAKEIDLDSQKTDKAMFSQAIEDYGQAENAMQFFKEFLSSLKMKERLFGVLGGDEFRLDAMLNFKEIEEGFNGDFGTVVLQYKKDVFFSVDSHDDIHDFLINREAGVDISRTGVNEYLLTIPEGRFSIRKKDQLVESVFTIERVNDKAMLEDSVEAIKFLYDVAHIDIPGETVEEKFEVFIAELQRIDDVQQLQEDYQRFRYYLPKRITSLNKKEELAAVKDYFEAIKSAGIFKMHVSNEQIKDKAMVQTDDKHVKGGIDLNSLILEMNVEQEGSGIEFPQIDEETLNSMQINGLVPIIINVTPVNNVLPLLGLKEEEQNFELAEVS